MKHLLRGAFFLALLALVSHVIPCALGQRDVRKNRLLDAEGRWVWQNPLPQGNDLRNASFIDANTGTVVGFFGTIVRTTDGGESWVIQTSGTTQNLWGVSFSDANNGTTVGEGGAQFSGPQMEEIIGLARQVEQLKKFEAFTLLMQIPELLLA